MPAARAEPVVGRPGRDEAAIARLVLAARVGVGYVEQRFGHGRLQPLYAVSVHYRCADLRGQRMLTTDRHEEAIMQYQWAVKVTREHLPDGRKVKA